FGMPAYKVAFAILSLAGGLVAPPASAIEPIPETPGWRGFVLGGAGYIEESVLPRLHRQAPLNSIWEGSGNVMCLDVLRAMGRSPESVEAFFDRHFRNQIFDRDLLGLSHQT
ncbi:MAG: hypothetical protein HC779_06500, partial [Phyllobacteriaceae bacterium]|nr:hypothetical protein [Phyllobacteriaceae bacterium]